MAREVERLVNEAKMHEAEDQKQRELVEARNSADNLVYGTEKALSDLGDKVPAEDRGRIEQLIEELKAIKDKPVSLELFAPHVSSETCALIDRMMARRPNDRYGQRVSPCSLDHNSFCVEFRLTVGTTFFGIGLERRGFIDDQSLPIDRLQYTQRTDVD